MFILKAKTSSRGISARFSHMSVAERDPTFPLLKWLPLIPVAHVHDEYQFLSRPDIADELGEVAVQAIVQAGEHFGFRCPLDGEYKIGKNWAETH